MPVAYDGGAWCLVKPSRQRLILTNVVRLASENSYELIVNVSRKCASTGTKGKSV